MWLTPLWLLVMIPVLDRMTSRFWKTVAYVLLFVSVFSMDLPDVQPLAAPVALPLHGGPTGGFRISARHGEPGRVSGPPRAVNDRAMKLKAP